MFKVRINRKGVVLFIVLGVVLITATLAAVVINLVLSHYRLTHHQSSRIQAYYASMAGVNYAIEQLRTGAWAPGTNCPAPECLVRSVTSCACTMSFAVNDFKPSVLVRPPNGVTITIIAIDSPGCPSPPAPAGGACISVTADYAYTPTP